MLAAIPKQNNEQAKNFLEASLVTILYANETLHRHANKIYDALLVNAQKFFHAVEKEAPYVISKSGYATFLLFIDIHLKKLSARAKPNKLRFCYNLVLDSQQSLHCLRYEKLIFVNPGEEFKANLLRAGGVSCYCRY